MEKMKIWDAVKQPPKTALKQISAGRLKGKTDISPQWRYQVMTEQFGPCGVGWKYEIKRVWSEPTIEDQVFAFAEVNVFIKTEDGWSDPIPGIGGSMAVAKENRGPYASDECFKMAVTDALSVALKMLGVAADIYAGLWDGSKYLTPSNGNGNGSGNTAQRISTDQITEITDLLKESSADIPKFLQYMGIRTVNEMPANQYNRAIAALRAKLQKQEA